MTASNIPHERIFIDKQSGKNTARPGLQKLLAKVKCGDTVVVESVSRFARNTRQFHRILRICERRTQKIAKANASAVIILFFRPISFNIFCIMGISLVFSSTAAWPTIVNRCIDVFGMDEKVHLVKQRHMRKINRIIKSKKRKNAPCFWSRKVYGTSHKNQRKLIFAPGVF